MIAHKIVEVDPDGSLWSARAPVEWRLNYVPNIPTKAKLGQLFVFRDYDTANYYANVWFPSLTGRHLEVWKCRIKGKTNRRWMAPVSWAKHWQQYWTDKDFARKNRDLVLPYTWCVEEVTLLEKV